MPTFMWTCERGHHQNISMSEEDYKQHGIGPCLECASQDSQYAAMAKAIASEVERMLVRRGVIKNEDQK